MVHSTAIWYDILTCRDIFEGNEAKWCNPDDAFWDIWSTTFRLGAPDPLANYFLLFISASDTLNCANSWLYQTQNVCVCMNWNRLELFNVKTCGCSPLTHIDLHSLLQFWVHCLFDFLEKVVDVATPV